MTIKTKKVKVFLLRNVKYDFETMHTNPEFGGAGEYAVLGSGTVTITMLPKAEVANNQVDALKKSKQIVLGS